MGLESAPPKASRSTEETKSSSGEQTHLPPAVARRGSIFVEYILLVTIVGIGVIVGLAVVRVALVNELQDLANAINAII